MNIVDCKSKSNKYIHENNIVFSCKYHVIFTTKYRRKVLSDDIQSDLKQIILNNQEKYKYSIVEMEIMPDHVHLLIESNPKVGIYPQICKIKGLSSNILRKKYNCLKSKLPCLWTRSTFIATVGSVSLEVVMKYIENQKNV